MLKKILVTFIPLVLSGCNHPSDDEIISDAKKAVIQELKSTYKPDECLRWKMMESGGAVQKGAAVMNCDKSMNPNKEITFSELKVYRHKDHNSVCGIVSGSTDISRIGARFAYSSAETNSPFLYYSKYPVIESSSDTKQKAQVLKILSTQSKIEHMANCK